MPVANRIKNQRTKLRITQTELARAARLTPAAISQFESGARKPSFDALSKLAKALKVTTDYLLGMKQPDGLEGRVVDETGGSGFRVQVKETT